MTENLLAELKNFTGTEHWYRHSLVRSVTYTDGVQYLAEHANCYWLVDKIAANQMLPAIKAEEFQVWKLRVADNKGDITVEDGNGNKMYEEKLDYTDFPLPEIDVWCVHGTILLPGEY